jgi:hypothetical protein
MANPKQVNSFKITRWAWQKLSIKLRYRLLNGAHSRDDYIGKTVKEISGMAGNRPLGKQLREEVGLRLDIGSWA